MIELRKFQNDLRNTLQNIILVSEYPKSTIEFTFDIIESDGFNLSNIMNAASYTLQLAALKCQDTLISSATV